MTTRTPDLRRPVGLRGRVSRADAPCRRVVRGADPAPDLRRRLRDVLPGAPV